MPATLSRLQNKKRVTGLGDGAKKDLPAELACDHGGVYTHIEDGGDLRSAMSAFYQYYAAGLAGADPQARQWRIHQIRGLSQGPSS